MPARRPNPAASKLLRFADVADFLGVSMRTVKRMRSMGQLPPPVKVSPLILAWRPADLEKWVANRIETPRGRRVKTA